MIKKEPQRFHSEGIKLGNLCFNGGKDKHKEDVFVSQKEQRAFLRMPYALSDTASFKVQEIRRVKIEFTAGEEVESRKNV